MISWRFSGFLLGLSWVALACLPLATQAGTFKRITIDGSFTDWAGVPALVDDGVDSAANVVDYGKVYVANDDDYLYVRFTTSKIVNPFTSHENIFIDTDNDSSTGYQTHVGSELLIQGGTGYQEKSGVFNAGTIEGLDWKAMPTDNAADFEMRISRRAKYSSDGLPVFVGDVIQLVLEAETASFAGSLPTFSKGRTAMCSSVRPNHPVTRSRTGGTNESAASTTATPPIAASQRFHFDVGAAGTPQTGREACSSCLRNSAALMVEGRVAGLVEVLLDDWPVIGDGSIWLRNSFRSATISRQL